MQNRKLSKWELNGEWNLKPKKAKTTKKKEIYLKSSLKRVLIERVHSTR